ncbi:UNVERIFIED_CONTAM: hypothetical protein HDU68_004540 [Siphonaria sp. JEL0065]|nr:hypothetical protein HDU68_004540 [Siphonaria sp. JEL0065]
MTPEFLVADSPQGDSPPEAKDTVNESIVWTNEVMVESEEKDAEGGNDLDDVLSHIDFIVPQTDDADTLALTARAIVLGST